MLTCHLVISSQRRGAVAPLTALCLALLVGVTALVIDGGTLMEARRHVQAAADAAALAGAADLYTNFPANQGYDYSGSAFSSAQSTASANGFADGSQGSVTITVPTSPGSNQTYQGGPNAGQPISAGYIEVIIQYNAPHLFSGVFGAGTSTVYARAVARGRSSPVKSDGVAALSLSAAGALNVGSGGGLSVNGGIRANSSNSSALDVSAQVTASLFTLNSGSGDQQGGGGLLGGLLKLLSGVLSLLTGPNGATAALVNSPSVPDPLRALSPPDQSQLSSQTPIWSGRTVTCPPGIYNTGIQVSGGSLLSPITLQLGNSDGTPGVYYLNANGFQVSGWVNITTTSGGVVIYNNWSDASTDTINVSTYGSIAITPPTSGPSRGVSIFQRRGTYSSLGPAVTLNAKGSANLTGTIYAAYANVNLTASRSNNVMGSQIIADTVTTSGSVSLNIDPTQSTANQRVLGLVE